MSLKKQAVSGLMWTFSQQFGTQLISFVVGIVLARLLLPSDFGIIAMFGVIVGVATTLVDGGMTSSLIRTNELDDKDLSTVFWFNIAVAFGVYWIIFFTAPLVARFYEVEILTPIIRVYSIIIFINAFVGVQSTRFVKYMDFKTLFKIRLPSLIIGGIVGVWMAWKGFGIWALVLYPIVQSVLSAIQIWLYSKWRPSFVFDKEKYKYHFNYGYKLTLSGLLDNLFRNIYTIVIGKMFLPQQLGYYNRAEVLKQLPVTNLSQALNKVTFPLFAKINNENGDLTIVFKKIMNLVIFLFTPMMTIAIVCAEPLIRLILTEKWLPSVPYFQVLAFAGILIPIHSYNLNILKIKGRSDLFLKLEIWKKILVIVILAFSVHYGIMGIVWGQVLASFTAFFINSYYSGKIINYNTPQQICDLLPAVLLAGLIGVFVYGLDFYFFKEMQDILRLIVLSLIYGMIFMGISFVFKFKEINYIRELIKR